MIFRVFRSSGLPLVLEPEELDALDLLEKEGRWTEYDHYQKELRNNDGLVDMMVEAHSLEELRFFLDAIDPHNAVILDFKNMIVTIMDNGRDS